MLNKSEPPLPKYVFVRWQKWAQLLRYFEIVYRWMMNKTVEIMRANEQISFVLME